MQISPSRKPLLIIAAILSLAGCATNSPSTSAALVQQASQAMASGSNEKAITLLNEATKANPTDGDAWARLAQAYFDNKDYPKAITAASEALARQPNNQEARGVQFVSSMRLAMSTLADIRKSNSQLAGNNRAEAEQVVRSLRDTLGETVLLPPTSNGANTARNEGRSGSGSSTATNTGRTSPPRSNHNGTRMTAGGRSTDATGGGKTPTATVTTGGGGKPPSITATTGSGGGRTATATATGGGGGRSGGTPFDILK